MSTPKEPDDILQSVIDERKADVFIYSADIEQNHAYQLLSQVQLAEDRKENCILILTTYGGDPDAAFRIIKCIRKFYKHITLFVFGPCKSAGTLIALGVDEIRMGLYGEFGPLDIQLTKDDEFITNTSGVSYLQMLDVLNEKLFSTFEDSFLKIKHRSRYAITTKTAGEICSSLATGLISPISAQIDPLKLGDIQRAINITYAYGQRLGATKETLDRLILGYPSHSFVIDIDEAVKIFGNVQPPSILELQFEQCIATYVRFVPEQPIIQQLKSQKNTKPDEPVTTNNTEQPEVANAQNANGNSAGSDKKRSREFKKSSAPQNGQNKSAGILQLR